MKLFIFGSTGDLVKRKVMKALQELGRKDLEIYAVGRKDMDRKEYQNFICSDWCSLEFKDSLHYVNIDFTSLNVAGLEKYLDKSSENYFYISLPQSEYKKVFKLIEKIFDKDYDVKVLVEKPFGSDMKTALDLKSFVEDSILRNNLFISDHYLFKKNFMNLPKKFWKVKLVSIESLGLEGRITYYDKIGALKDMIQSHFVNLILKNMNFNFNVSDVLVKDFIKGQYKGYEKELGKKSETETFVYIKFECCGKLFEFITGKAFADKEGYVEIDGEKFDMGEDNSYIEIFRKFFSDEMSGFPTVEDSILGWEFIERLEESGKDSELKIYEKGSELDDVLAQKNS